MPEVLRNGWLNVVGHLLAQLFVLSGQREPFEGKYDANVLQSMPGDVEGVFLVVLYVHKSQIGFNEVTLTEAGMVKMLMERMKK